MEIDRSAAKIRYWIDVMITKSSNLATNILIERVGAENVTKIMRSYGADSIQVLVGVRRRAGI
jgi:beta-lactamase class A